MSRACHTGWRSSVYMTASPWSVSDGSDGRGAAVRLYKGTNEPILSASQGVMGREWEVVVVALGQGGLRECLAFSRWLSLPKTPGPSPGPEVPVQITRSIPIVEVRTQRPKGTGACPRSHTRGSVQAGSWTVP